jgi:hypothetical protein
LDDITATLAGQVIKILIWVSSSAVVSLHVLVQMVQNFLIHCDQSGNN